MKRYSLIFIVLFSTKANAQFVQTATPIIENLCSEKFGGRGYINDGVNIAADYLATEFQKIGMKKFEGSYFQNYTFCINTIQDVSCNLDGKQLQAGQHFLVDAPCPDVNGTFTILHFDFTNEVDKQLLFSKLKQGWSAQNAICLQNADNGRAVNKMIDSISELGFKVPLVIKSTSKKLLWTTSQDVDKIPTLTFPDTIIKFANQITINIDAKLISNFKSKNIIGYLPGKKNSTSDYIVFTAHYDHLGMMGKKSFFPGASDNASGTSMVLSIAKYFSENKVDYPIVFMLFSGEEVGLLGSKYYAENPLFDIRKIKMLVNIDIMGNAEEGITVVNGETFKTQFDQLVSINNSKKYLPQVKIRGKTSNSDHYFFSEAGIPSFFIYSNGGVGFYHDVWDKPNTISLKNFDGVAQLLVDFAKETGAGFKLNPTKMKKKTFWEKLRDIF